jgi:hypothetical protein
MTTRPSPPATPSRHDVGIAGLGPGSITREAPSGIPRGESGEHVPVVTPVQTAASQASSADP